MEKPSERSQIIEKLVGPRADILLSIDEIDPNGTSKHKLPEGISSTEYHLGILLDWELIEITGEDDTRPGYPARRFGLTDEGEKLVTELLATDLNGYIPPAAEHQIKKLEARIDDLEDELENETDRLDNRIDALKETVRTVIGRLKDLSKSGTH